MRRRTTLILTGSLFLVLAAAAGLRFALFVGRSVAPPAPVTVNVPPGAPFAAVAGRLAAEGVVAGAAELKLLARLRDDARRVQAGEYDFRDPATPGDVLDRLVAGDVRRYRFTVPEGLTVKEVAARLEAEGYGDGDRFLALAADPAAVRDLAPTAPSLEGYLFPETYTLVAGTTEARLLSAMVDEFRRRLDPELAAAAKARGLDLHQLVTLASIIQKEAGSREEMPLIAAVFHNRLKRRMPLQADPTVIYGIEDFDGNLTRRHLLTPTPYNTYRIAGLPPGPIAAPGEDALRAAAEPASVDYLYFVARGDGSHVFSKTLVEHNRNVRRYQLRR